MISATAKEQGAEQFTDPMCNDLGMIDSGKHGRDQDDLCGGRHDAAYANRNGNSRWSRPGAARPDSTTASRPCCCFIRSPDHDARRIVGRRNPWHLPQERLT